MSDMENNYSSTDRPAGVNLSLPHFDEEATVLSARPVVPLEEIRVETRSRRNLVFALTIVAAILVGAIGATLLMRPEQTSQTASEGQVSEPLAVPTGAAGGVTSETAESKVPVPRLSDEVNVQAERPDDRESSIKQRPAAVNSRSSMKAAASRSIPKPVRVQRRDYEVVEDFKNDERELRRAERREARREARRQHRQRRETDDLLRIREIFEGAPRP
jgi:hypothetical protein